MTSKSLNDLYNRVRRLSAAEAIEDEETSILISESIEELSSVSDIAKEIILGKISEKEFIRLMDMIQNITTATAVLTTGETGLLAANMDGSLQAYTHSVVLCVIGELIQDEVL